MQDAVSQRETAMVREAAKPGQKKRNRRALFSAIEERKNKAEPKFDGSRLDLRLPATRDILNDDTLKKEEDLLREPVFAEQSSPKQKQLPKSKDAGYNITALKKVVQSTAAEIDSQALNQSARKHREADKNWHEITERLLTPEEERDARVIENRAFLDPKRFYRASGTGRKRGELPTRVHFGTVVVGPHEFFSSRLTRKERKPRIIDEVLADDRVVSYAKRRSAALQKAKAFKRVVDPAIRKRHNRR